MSSKVRIVGAFGADAADKVRAFADSLEGVESVSLLVDGVEAPTGSEPEPEPEPEAAE